MPLFRVKHEMSLEISRHIVPQNWMRSQSLNRLFEILQGGIPEGEPQALLVGGCVRNVLLGQEVDDIDIATPLLPEYVSEILTAHDVKVIPTGLDHGTVTAIIDDVKAEITTLRHDTHTDGRHAAVSFTECWIEDAKRRDFTMNTLLMDLVGNVYDPLGQGLDDLDARCVRFVGNAEKRIKEDHLRILRFFRFTSRYGNGFDMEGLKACQAGAHLIVKLSKERVTQEFFKIIAGDKPHEVLGIMFEHDILSDIKPIAYDADFLAAFVRFQSSYHLGSLSSRILVFAGLDFDAVKPMEKYILFPKVFIKDMQAINGALNLSDLSCDTAIREAVYRFGRVATAQALMIELVQDRVMNRYAPVALKVIQGWDIPEFPVSGHDLMEAGIKKGPELGITLDTLEEYWIKSDFKLQKTELLKRI